MPQPTNKKVPIDDMVYTRRRDAKVLAERLADAAAQVISDLDDPRGVAIMTDGLPGLVHDLAAQCAQLRLLHSLARASK